MVTGIFYVGDQENIKALTEQIGFIIIMILSVKNLLMLLLFFSLHLDLKYQVIYME